VKALLVIAALARVAAADDSWRCPNGIVKVGDRVDDVQARCGAPSRSEHHVEKRAVRGYTTRVGVDTWTYDRGPSELVRVLTFVDGALQTIDVGGYGSPAAP